MGRVMYKNGNSIVYIDTENGTKERMTEDDKFDLDFPESIDLNIGNRCDGGCKYCYINASPNGKDGELMTAKFIDTIHHYTEVAINGNSIDHPQLIPFLRKLKERRIFANLTVNQIHFERKEDIIRQLVNEDLVKGIGISLRKPTAEFIQRVTKYPNAVIHVINGIVTAQDLEMMRDHNIKLLILGYKDLGRGSSYKEENEINIKYRQKYLYDVLETLPHHFRVVAFDNLALSQLKPQRFIPREKWDKIYLGDEGTSSMYVDLVTNKFGVSSLCKEDEMMPLMDNIKDMFKVVKSFK